MNADLIVDAKLRKAYEKDGFVVAPLLESADIEELSSIYRSFPSGMSSGFYTTLWSEDSLYRRAVREVVERVLSRRLSGIIEGGRVILGQFAVKQAGGGDSTCPMHCDWSFTDESVHHAVSLWIPLIDIVPEVGPLRVVPGSHRVFRRIRPNQPQSLHYNVFDDILPDLEAKRSREVFMRAGEAVIYDGAILHGSRGNRSDRDRVAVVAVVVPPQARLYHYWQEDLRFAEAFEVDEEFLATEVRWGRRPQGQPCIDIIDLPSRESPLTLAEFDRDVSLPSTKRLSLSSLDPWRVATLDDSVQSELDHLGWSKQKILLDAELQELRRCIEPYWLPTAAEQTLAPGEAIGAIERLVGPKVARLFPDHEMVRASVVTSGTSLEHEKDRLIQDELLVDGTRHRPLSLLLALGGVDEQRGSVSVLDGSHRTSRRSAGPGNSEPTLEVDSVIWSRLTRLIGLKEGEGLVYDSRLLYSILPSRLNQPFFAIRIDCVPRGAQIRSYRRLPAEGLNGRSGTADHQPALNESRDGKSPGLGTHPHSLGDVHALQLHLVERPASGWLSRDIVSSAAVGRLNRPDQPIRSAEITQWLRSAESMDNAFVPPLALGEIELMSNEYSQGKEMPGDSTQGETTRRIFKDRALEEEFRHLGYVIVPLLDEATVGRLLEFFYSTSPPNIAGFHGTMYHNDRDYRVRVDEVLRPALEQAVSKYLIDYRCVMCNFMVKEPGEQASEMPLHLDWSFVKEPRLRSVHIWCPLVDVDHTNGNLAVTPGTHHLGDPVRAFADDFPFREQIALLRDRFTRELPMSAGQAVLFDGGLLHSSPANMSQARRVTAQAIGIPMESPVYHSWRATPTQVETFQLPDEFFFDYVLHQRPQNIEPVEVIEYVPRQRTAEELLVLEEYQPSEAARADS